MKAFIFEPRPATCIDTGVHWDVDGRCFFCNQPTFVIHHDEVGVAEPGKKKQAS